MTVTGAALQVVTDGPILSVEANPKNVLILRDQVELNGLYNIVIEQVERPLLEIALKAHNGNQVKTAQMLGINRNTLKKKIDNYKIRVKKITM